MFDKDFYPTPPEVADKMLEGLDFRFVSSVLEPSAGKGNLVDAVTSRKRHNIEVDCIERNRDLQNVLKGKGYRVVHDDFLTYDAMTEYDLILMNPPFSDGCKHLMKALEMQKRNGGAVICLLNAETIKNPYTNERTALVRLLDEYKADIQYINGAFARSERKTDVEIALIKVKLPEVRRESFIWENLRMAKAAEENEQKDINYLAENDLLKSIVAQYKMEAEAGIRLIKEYQAMEKYVMSSFKKDEKTGEVSQSGNCILSLSVRGQTVTINSFLREVRRKYWRALLENPKFVGQLTENLQHEYYNMLGSLVNYEFSLYNIYEIKADMLRKVSRGIEETIISLFDEFSRKHSYYDKMSNNIHYYNGWKTNKAWIVNKKVIIPLQAYYDLNYSRGGFRPTRREVAYKLKDIEKCLNYLDGGRTESINLEKSLKFSEDNEETKNIELKYFTVTFYKKGTCHITFTNDELLKKFNIFGSQRKGWLPPGYGKKSYADMTSEERQVIDEFEGEKSYMDTFTNHDYYLTSGSEMLMLETA